MRRGFPEASCGPRSIQIERHQEMKRVMAERATTPSVYPAYIPPPIWQSASQSFHGLEALCPKLPERQAISRASSVPPTPGLPVSTPARSRSRGSCTPKERISTGNSRQSSQPSHRNPSVRSGASAVSAAPLLMPVQQSPGHQTMSWTVKPSSTFPNSHRTGLHSQRTSASQQALRRTQKHLQSTRREIRSSGDRRGIPFAPLSHVAPTGYDLTNMKFASYPTDGCVLWAHGSNGQLEKRVEWPPGSCITR